MRKEYVLERQGSVNEEESRVPLSSVCEACLGQMSSASLEFLSGLVWPPVEVCGCVTEILLHLHPICLA